MTDPITTETASLGEKISLLPKMLSTYAALLGAALIAAPVDWATLDFKAITLNQVVVAVVWFVGWCSARVKAQPSVAP
jgi:hypothetical protein